jgi:N-methylhydantoinase B
MTQAFSALDLTVFAQSVAMVAEEMGTRLERGALSPNIRERRDASSALFDGAGRMIAQAAHIPVHLGAMPESVAAVRRREARAGEVWLLNHPEHGGSHLPDLTMVEAIGDGGEGDAVIGYAAVRAHHADVGGMSPGSMPFGARELVQEGLVVPPVIIADRGGWRDDVLRLVLANVRTPDERLGDLAAQRAACAAGAAGWHALWRARTAHGMEAACAALLDYTERRVRARLEALDGLHGVADDVIEGDGVTSDLIHVRAAVRVSNGTLFVDLTGTAPRVAGNVNAPAAVARAAAVFVLRAVCDADVPTNDGIARALTLAIPDDCVANARNGAAVAAGNVELSQRLTDVLWLALADAAHGADLPLIAQGQGDDEQRHPGRGRLDLLRNARWRAGRAPARQRTERGARRDEQHAQYAHRSARAGVSAARRPLRHPARFGRRRSLDGWRRSRTCVSVARGVHRHGAGRSPRAATTRCGGRWRRRGGAYVAQWQGVGREGPCGAHAGRCAHPRDARRRRLGRGLTRPFQGVQGVGVQGVKAFKGSESLNVSVIQGVRVLERFGRSRGQSP